MAERIRCAEISAEQCGPALAGADLSDWFTPFLPSFGRETIAAGGRALVASDDGAVVGLLLTDRSERLSSLFSRSATAARLLGAFAEGTATFAEVDLGGRQESYRIHAAELLHEPVPRLQHRLRCLAPSELAVATRVVQEVYGGHPEPWVRAVGAEGELCLAAEVGNETAGVAWVGLSGRHARLHTLAVRPGYRRLGVASDLIAARLWRAWHAGARRAISEIAESNLPSRTAAERFGLRAAGPLFLHLPPADAGPVGP